MEHIEIFIYGRDYGKSGSAFGVILISRDNKWKKSLAYGKYSTNNMDIKALQFGLLSISENFKDKLIKVFTKNKYIIDMLEKDKNGFYTKIPKSYIDDLSKVRGLVDQLNIEFVLDSASENMNECKLISQNAAEGNPADKRK